MERLTAIVIFSLLFSITSVGQNSGDVQITHMPKYKSADTAYSYRLYGEKSGDTSFEFTTKKQL